ncbi:putative zinc-binding alcohol dehydrogenase [Tolypocladium ophioglossoides CBS 100239]|uniref:Putative zinc-binding alcohol dehydrogenase n=1 Tax=Tolypocladium ophioglossoides (strain CBS 100239) TaxID=1163406 RepID=A0A0L0MZ36_TOLOC|nr:putative zinc-binding alcohol dehydrogenase [Tolypocladium ophioglossoides CBS 100239]
MPMKAVIFRGAFDVAVESRPKPTIVERTDAIIRVELAGICGSELHMYRGHQKTAAGHIMGHEFIGTVEEVGEQVTRFSPGDHVVSIFSPICLKCWFCKQGLTNRCVEGVAFGTQNLAGGQAEFVRVPFADGTLQPVPADLDNSLLIMMCDIFPTGYYGACRAIEGLQTQFQSRLTSFNGPVADGGVNEDRIHYALSQAVVVCLGCGPVGICAIATARSKGIHTVFAVDSVDDRLEEAAQLGAIPLNLSRDDIMGEIKSRTEGRGADAVIEVVGSAAALKSAFDLLRPCGVLSSVGFHQSGLPFTGLDCYLKNITMNFGRVPVRTVFHDALGCLKENQSILKHYVSHELPLDDAATGYALFEQRKARKVVLRL